MRDRCVLPPKSPAVSLRTAHCLPAGRLLLWVSSSLIYITLWTIRQAICGVASNFLPALREARADRSFQPRTGAVDVVGAAGTLDLDSAVTTLPSTTSSRSREPNLLVPSGGRRLVRAQLRRADGGAGGGVAGDPGRPACADRGADRLGQDARRLSGGDRRAGAAGAGGRPSATRRRSSTSRR